MSMVVPNVLTIHRSEKIGAPILREQSQEILSSTVAEQLVLIQIYNTNATFFL